MFVASLQEGEFPRHDPGPPLLSDERRARLRLPERIEPELEERYLFAVCLSRPTHRLWLSWRSADERGRAVARSPFVEEVRDLLAPPRPADPAEPDPVEDRICLRRGLAGVVFAPSEAPNASELARSLAVLGPERAAEAAGKIEMPGPVRAEIGGRLIEAIGIVTERLHPGPLRLQPVIAELAERDLFSATTLEEYKLCPYRWFADHELDPQRLDPTEPSLAMGSLAHNVLEALYREPPNGSRRPTAETLAAWSERAKELIAELAPQLIAGDDPESLSAVRRVEGLVVAFLADEARVESEISPELTEASFGFDGDEVEGLALGNAEEPPFRLRGRIDRVDSGGDPDPLTVIHDYKLGRKVLGAGKLTEEGKLQLQLYLVALRRRFEREPAGGLYRPLGGTTDRKPRGLVREGAADRLGLHLTNTDVLPDDEFDAMLDDAESEATKIVALMRSGHIDRDPLGGECPSWCHFQPICRRERGLPDLEAEDEEENGGEPGP